MADMDRLIGRIPAFSVLSSEERKSLLKDIHYLGAPEGTAIVRQGETSDAAYFITAKLESLPSQKGSFYANREG